MFDTLLIANRGEIARRVNRTAQAMGLTTVAVFSDADADAPHVHEADVAVRLPGTRSSETYLRRDVIVEAAQRAGAGAIHPGYGFLSEDPAFAQACAEAGIVLVGPPTEAMRVMGSKIESKRVVVAAGVPVAPSAELSGDDAPRQLLDAGRRVGYPLLVKASAGGGGRGMRRVDDEADLPDAVRSARREAAGAFGDDTVFLEKIISPARHVEVQVAADRHGTVCALADRDCSVQRRNQKIVEEAPAPGLAPELRSRMADAAIACARSVDYEGVGTVEFLVDDAGFYFLEMNTRLQVEHPVTEEVLGLDLVRLQIEVAQGIRIDPQIRTEGRGHAIEARIYAEDPAHEYLPSPGTITAFRLAAGEGVRCDSAVETGSVVSEHYDPLIAKVIAHGANRDEAIRRLRRCLRRFTVAGVTTNRDQLLAVLDADEFRSARMSTELLAERTELNTHVIAPRRLAHVLTVAAVWSVHSARSEAVVLPGLSIAFRNVVDRVSTVRLRFAGADHDVAIGLDERGGRSSVRASIGEESVVADLRPGPADGVDIEFDGIRERYHVEQVGEMILVDSSSGQWALTRLPLLADAGSGPAAGSFAAPLPGAVLDVMVSAGDPVSMGQCLVVLEAMKMEHRIVAEVDGVVDGVFVVAGQQVKAGEALLALG